MKKILILSFLYENDINLEEFELLREHYNKMISYFCFPIKYYGVRATEHGETRIDEDNQIIWLRTDNIEEYDKKLIYKVVDCFDFIEKNDIEYDVIIKTNTTFLINLTYINNIIQNLKSNSTIITSYRVGNYAYQNFNLYRGNFIALSKCHINDIINANIQEIHDYFLTSNFFKVYKDNLFISDDAFIGYILKEYNEVFFLGMYNLTREVGEYPLFSERFTKLENIEDIFDAAGVNVKDYENEKSHNLELTILKIFINYTQKLFIKRNSYKSFTQCIL